MLLLLITLRTLVKVLWKGYTDQCLYAASGCPKIPDRADHIAQRHELSEMKWASLNQRRHKTQYGSVNVEHNTLNVWRTSLVSFSKYEELTLFSNSPEIYVLKPNIKLLYVHHQWSFRYNKFIICLILWLDGHANTSRTNTISSLHTLLCNACLLF